MKTQISYNTQTYEIDLTKPLDISIPLKGNRTNPSAWYMPPPEIQPFSTDSFPGSLVAGGSVNFNTITFNPHAHGTHTECVGHITKEVHKVNQCLERFFYLSQLVTIAPEKSGGDFIISEKQLKYALHNCSAEAIVIRTMPNTRDKLVRQYSHTNPPYLTAAAAAYLANSNVMHLLIDLPSIDKEKDDGILAAHNAFWDTGKQPREKATITEFIYVKNSIEDGTYFLNLQLANIENDASPSRPILYKTKIL